MNESFTGAGAAANATNGNVAQEQRRWIRRIEEKRNGFRAKDERPYPNDSSRGALALRRLFLVAKRQRANRPKPLKAGKHDTVTPCNDLAALAAQADVIIPGDRDLLTLKTHGGVRIRSPRQFMDAPKA